MLLNTFTLPQKLAFLKLVRDISSADKVVNVGERELIDELCAEMGISLTSSTKSVKETSLDVLFESFEDRALVMLELARLSMADRTIGSAENQAMHSIRRKLGFSRKDMSDILRLAEIYVLLRKGISALAEAGRCAQVAHDE